MGAVFRVTDTHLAREVAIKMLVFAGADAELVTRFQREAQLVSSLNHPNIVSVLDFGITGSNKPYMVLEFVHGKTLNQIIRESRGLRIAQALPMFIQIARGLSHAHSRNIFHRDIKPSNIVVSSMDSEEPVVKILDFGLAKTHSAGSETLTRPGAVMGSPLYMSPEQALGQPADQRTDIYSLGCLMFESLVGRAPIVGDTAMETITLKTTRTAPKLDAAVFPEDLVDIVARCLETEPLNRFQTVDDLLNDLENFCADYLASGQEENVQEVSSDASPAPKQGVYVTPQMVSARSSEKSKILAPLAVIAVGLAAVFLSMRLLQTDETMRLQRIADRKVDLSRFSDAGASKYEVEDKLSVVDDPQRKPRPIKRKILAPDQNVVAVYNEAVKSNKSLGWVAMKVSGIEATDSDQTKILKLESFRTLNPYDKAVNNELRHLYLSRSLRKSMECCDRILERYPMDDYTLRCLSSWSKGGDPSEAYMKFLAIHKSFPDLKFVNAACLISAGDAAAALGDFETARELFHQVGRGNDEANKEDLAEYRSMAVKRMRRLESSP